MAKMKQLLTDIAEFEGEIVSLLTRTQKAHPVAFALFFDEDLSSRVQADFFRQFSNDEELIGLAAVAIELDFVKFGDGGLSLMIPK